MMLSDDSISCRARAKPYLKRKEVPSDSDQQKQQSSDIPSGTSIQGEEKDGETGKPSSDRSTGGSNGNSSSNSNSEGKKSSQGKTTTSKISTSSSTEQRGQVVKESPEQDVAWREPLLDM